MGLEWVLSDVVDGLDDTLLRIQEDFPTGAAPHGVGDGAPVVGDQVLPAGGLQILKHRLGPVAVLADEHVDVIRHDGTGVAGVPSVRDDLTDALGDQVDVFVGEEQERMAQNVAGLVIEASNFAA